MTYEGGARRPRFVGVTVMGHLAACAAWLTTTWAGGAVRVARTDHDPGGLVTAVAMAGVVMFGAIALVLTLVALGLSIPWWRRRGDRPRYPGWALAHALLAWVGGAVYAFVVA